MGKTGCFKELAPYGDDWYYIRAASIARKIYLRPGLGVGMLQKWYGGNYRRGARTEHFRKASAGIIRSVLIQLEEMRVVEPYHLEVDVSPLLDNRIWTVLPEACS